MYGKQQVFLPPDQPNFFTIFFVFGQPIYDGKHNMKKKIRPYLHKYKLIKIVIKCL